jgi:hypothetical protein
MQIKPGRAALAVLLTSGMGTAAMAVPSFHSSLSKAVKAIQTDVDEAEKPYQWALPSFIQAGPVQKEISLFVGDTCAGFKGRKFNIKQAQATIGITSRLQLLYGEQYFFAKGRSSTSRLDVADSYYGIRGVVKPPTAKDPTSLSLQFLAIRPDTASVVVGNTSALFDGTHNNQFSANYLDGHKNELQIQYTSVTETGGLSANVVTFGIAHDYQLSEFLRARVQGQLVSESFNGSGVSSNFELRPIFTGALVINPAPWLSIEGDGVIMPSGVPLAGGEFTAVSGLYLNNPGGVIDDIRKDFVAFASVRLLFHGKF